MENARELLNRLPTLTGYRWDTELKDLVEIPVTPQEYAFVRVDENILRVSAEQYDFADYYNEFGGGYPHIHAELEAWAEKRGGFWEWENPSNIAFYEL